MDALLAAGCKANNDEGRTREMKLFGANSAPLATFPATPGPPF